MAKKNNTGRSFEKLAESIFNKLVVNPALEKVEHNVKVPGKDGSRQIDVLVTSESVGIKFTTAIECKDYNSKLSVGVVDGFHSVMTDINANKGILISKKGFSSTAVLKAKRLGITLCTAHEAMKDSWNPDIDLPILIKEVTPIEFNFSHKTQLNKGDVISTIDFPEINGQSLLNLVENKWRNGSLQFRTTRGFQKIELPEIEPPYNLVTKDGSKREVHSFEVAIKFKFRHFLTTIGQLEGSQILQNISDGRTDVFFEIPAIESLDQKFIKVPSKVENDFTGIIFGIHVIPSLNSAPRNMTIVPSK